MLYYNNITNITNITRFLRSKISKKIFRCSPAGGIKKAPGIATEGHADFEDLGVFTPKNFSIGCYSSLMSGRPWVSSSGVQPS